MFFKKSYLILFFWSYPKPTTPLPSVTLITLISGAILTSFSISILVRSAKQSNNSSYEFLCHYALGKLGKTCVELCLMGFMLGIMIGYYIALGDLLPPIIFGDSGHLYRTKILSIVGLFLVQPLVLIKDISKITKANSASLCGYGIVTTVIIFKALMSGKFLDILNPFSFISGGTTNLIYWDSSHFFSTMSLFALGFACHPQVFIVYNDLQSKTGKVHTPRMERIVDRAISYVGLLYTTIGICGYLTFGSRTAGNLLTNYHNSSLLTQIMRSAFCFSCIISFPILIFPVRQSMFTLTRQLLPSFMFKNQQKESYAKLTEVGDLENDNKRSNQSGNSADDELFIPEKVFLLLSFSINFICLYVAINTPDIAVMLKLTGCTMGSLIAFILPALICLRQPAGKGTGSSGTPGSGNEEDIIFDKDEGIKPIHVMRAKLLLVVGILVFVITPITILMDEGEQVYTEIKEFQEALESMDVGDLAGVNAS